MNINQRRGWFIWMTAIILFLQVFALPITDASIICDLKAYLGTATTWSDPHTVYRLPAIPDFIENDGSSNAIRWRFGWAIKPDGACPSQQIGYDWEGPFLAITSENNHTTGYCTLTIVYPDNYDPTGSAPIYPCRFGDDAWVNNRIYYHFASLTTNSNNNDGGGIAPKNYNVAFSMPTIYPTVLPCELTQSDWSGAIDRAAAPARAFDRLTGRELDTVALDVRITDRTNDRCNHADYTIEIELGALEPSNENVTDVVARGYWIKAVVVDKEAPRLSNVAARPDFIPTQTECLWSAIDYASRQVPRQYNPNIVIEDNCAVSSLLPLVYDWKFTSDSDGQQPWCPHRGTVTMTWQTNDGCNNAASVIHPIRVRDESGPVLTKSVTWLKHCTTLSKRGLLCPDEFIRQKLMEAYTDNCDDSTTFDINIEWTRKTVELCRPTQQAGSIGKAFLQCLVRGGQTDTISEQCVQVDEEWTRIKVPYSLTDSCGNPAIVPINVFELLIAPTERSCTNYGYTV